jgi:hypothetical protein
MIARIRELVSHLFWRDSCERTHALYFPSHSDLITFFLAAPEVSVMAGADTSGRVKKGSSLAF